MPNDVSKGATSAMRMRRSSTVSKVNPLIESMLSAQGSGRPSRGRLDVRAACETGLPAALIQIQLWWDGHHLIVIRFDQLPAALMHHPVMPVAEKDQVSKVAVAALCPVHQVMA